MDPWSLRLRGGVIHRRDVERYKRDPRARATGGDPVCVVRLCGGGSFVREGAHRVTAARETGRRIRVLWVHEADEQATR
ncbi:hypothetical protein Ae406Ps2_3019c [Pseudonocardia sp. Ae406_Ps2]|nr:hypothetical protein Ae331Ps2_2909 [Pseudonocardia sp. Ae331_Ps2]OLM03019.1 hypothetical protein Ae406Ps2_3019c [Pseudonocardia sp. Ae406_Ps2]